MLGNSNSLVTETLTCCPICGHLKSEVVLTQADGYISTLYLHQCCGCQAIYLNPRLTPASIISVEDESEIYTFSREIAEEQIKGGLTRLFKWLETYTRTYRRQLLDIGCNRGLLMEAARRQGWQVTGVEISSESIKRARDDYGLTVYATVGEINENQQFDLITAWHVLEHTLDPIAFLKEAAARVCPGGVLAIQVPSFDYLEEFRRRQQLGSLVCAIHNFYFTPAILQMVLEKAGLKIIHIDNDSNSLLLTAIATKPMTTFNRFTKGWQLIRSRKWRAVSQEIHNYIRWKLIRT